VVLRIASRGLSVTGSIPGTVGYFLKTKGPAARAIPRKFDMGRGEGEGGGGEGRGYREEGGRRGGGRREAGFNVEAYFLLVQAFPPEFLHSTPESKFFLYQDLQS
jgi:hypothetical protein